MPVEQELLTEVRIAVAELRAEIRHINMKLDQAVVARADLERKLVPITESLNRGKGALAAATLMAGALGAVFSAAFRSMFGGASP